MNYALDAIWWRLSHPAVRDLAALLTAPPLWYSGCELPVPRLLGSQGFRFLISLDDAPAPLTQWLEQEASFGHRLGRYAESLLAFWLAHAPHCQLIARNHPIRSESGQTLGAADFLCLLDSVPYHLELTCKYYGGTTPADFQGLNPADTLLGKAAKLQQQCRLFHPPQARAQLPAPLQGYLKTSEASFCGAKTSEASFCEAKTSAASFCGAKTSEAGFCGAKTSEAGFCEAKTSEASTRETNTDKTNYRQTPNISQPLNTATIIRGIGFTPTAAPSTPSAGAASSSRNGQTTPPKPHNAFTPCPASPTSPPPAFRLSKPSAPPSSPAKPPASSPWSNSAPTACGTKPNA